MKKYYLGLLMFCSLLGFSQFQYEKGYYVDDTGTTVNGLIYNEEWIVTPTVATFKKDTNSPAIHLSAADIQSFGSETFKYVRHTVAIDRNKSVGMSEHNSNNGVPDFETKTLFLKVVVEGEAASLYSVIQDGYDKLFYKLPTDSVPVQLVYKRYRNDQGSKREIYYFRKVLFDKVKCPTDVFETFGQLEYTVASLKPIFEKFNKCSNKPYQQFDYVSKKFKLRITPFAGYSFISNKVDMNNRYVHFEDKTIGTPIIGVELSTSPFSYKAVEIFSRILFKKVDINHFSDRFGDYADNYKVFEVDMNYSAFTMYAGPRYYYDLSHKGQLFFDMGAGIELTIADEASVNYYVYENDVLVATSTDPIVEFTTMLTFSFGVGYVYKNKYGFDLRYDTINQGNGIEQKQRNVTATVRYTLN